MKPAFLLLCYLSGNPAGTMHLASIKDCIFYKDYLDNQNVKIGEEEKTEEVTEKAPSSTDAKAAGDAFDDLFNS